MRSEEPQDRNLYYLSGPMTGIPQYNIPLFELAAEALRKEGRSVIAPHELDDPKIAEECRRSPDGWGEVGGTWGEFLSRDVKLIADEVDVLVLLPGWKESQGALLEVYIALLRGVEVFSMLVDGDQPLTLGARIPRRRLLEAIMKGLEQ